MHTTDPELVFDARSTGASAGQAWALEEASPEEQMAVAGMPASASIDDVLGLLPSVDNYLDAYLDWATDDTGWTPSTLLVHPAFAQGFVSGAQHTVAILQAKAAS